MAEDLPDMSMFGGPSAAADGPDMSMFQAPKAKVKPRSNLERFTGNFTDAIQRSGLGQLSRSTNPQQFDFKDLADPANISRLLIGDGITIKEGGLADRGLDAVFGDERPILRSKARNLSSLVTGTDQMSPADAAEKARRAKFEATSQADPFYKAPGGAAGRVIAGASTLGGQLAGGMFSPENWVSPGKTLGQQIAGNAAVGTGTDVLLQGGDISTGVQDEFNPLQTAGSAAIAGAAPVVIKGISNATPDFVKDLFIKRGRDILPEEPAFESQVGQAPAANTPELVQRQKLVFANGTKADINKFYDEIGGPRPSEATIDNWLETREGLKVPAAPKPEALQEQIHRDTIRAHIDNETKAWKNKPQINVVGTLDEVNPQAREQALKEGITPENTVGFLGADGQVHIFANQIKTPEAASAVLFHEALGHYGLAQRFGTKLDSTLQTLVTRNVGQFAKKVDTWQRANPGAYGGNKLRAAEEVLAEMSQKGPLPKAIGDAIISVIRQFARNRGINLKYSDAEVSHILAMAHDAVINGKGRDVVGNRFGGLNQGTGYQATEFGASPESRQMYAGLSSKTFPTDVNDPKVFYGPDGYLRYEISDLNGRWDDWASLDHPEGADLDTVLIHPELFKAYPELRNVKVIRDVSEAGPANFIQGFFNPGSGNIHISPNAFDPRSTALHEIQHWIQFKEGFAYGGNSESIRLDNKEALGNLLKYYNRELGNVEANRLPRGSAMQGVRDVASTLKERIKKTEELIESSGAVKELYSVIDDINKKKNLIDSQLEKLEQRLGEMSPDDPQFMPLTRKYQEGFDARDRLLNRLNKVSEGIVGLKGRFSDLSYDMYNLLTGEVEARDVQARRNLSPEERAMSKPYSAEGIKPDEMIPVYPNRETVAGDLGRPTVDPNLLDDVDQLKQNPRFWSDPEFRANVIELARSRQPIEQGPGASAIPAPSGFKSEAEARAAANRRMTPEQLQRQIEDGSVDIERLERTYDRVYADYVPTTRSDAEVRRAAQAAGFTPAKVKGQKNMQDLSARIYGAQEAAKVLDEKLAALAEKEGTPDWSLRDADNARKAIADHYYILNRLYEDKSELGRALRIAKMGYTHAEMRAYKELLAEEGGTLSPLADDETLSRFLRSYRTLAAGGQNPNGVNALVMGLKKPNWEEYLLSARVNMMLSGLSTHVTAVTDMIDGIGLDLMDSTAGLIPSLGREGLRALGLPVKQGIHPAEVGARYWGVLRAAMEASTYVNALKTLREGSDRMTRSGRQYAKIPILGKVGDLIAAEDQFFRAFATNMHLYGLGVRKAVDEARAQGKKPTMDDLIAQGSSYARNPDKDLLAQAERASEENLLLAPNMLVTPLDALRRSGTVGPNATPQEKAVAGAQRAASFVINFMLPFVRTATNSLYQRVWRRTPLTMFDPHTLADLATGGVKADIAMGRIMLGTASVALYWAAAENGIVSGEGPDNIYKKAIKMATGWRPQSVKVEGEQGTRYNINQNLGNRLNIFDLNSQTATMVAGIHEAYKKGANEGQVATGMKLAIYSTVKSLLNNAWLGDIGKDIAAFQAPGNMVDKRDQWIADQIGSFTPNLLAQVAKVQDQGQPMTTVSGDLGETIENTVKARIPGLREQLPDRHTPFGTPIQSGISMGGQSTILPQGNRITGGAYINETTDPAELEVARLDELEEKAVVTAVRRTIKIDGENIRLNNEEFSQYQQAAGRAIIDSIREEMDTEEWAEMPDEEKAAWIRKMQKTVKKQVRDELFGGTEEDD